MNQSQLELIERTISKLEKKCEESISYTDQSNYEGQLLAYRRVLDLATGATEAFIVMNELDK